MKNKLCLIISIFIAIFSTLPITAVKPTSYTGIAKEKAMHQFNESLDRFKRCMHGKCTKTEALKAARDVGIAATLVITALYVTGSILEKGAKTIIVKTKKHPYHETIKNVTAKVYTPAKYMQKSGATITEHLIQKPISQVMRTIYPFQKGDTVTVKGRSDHWRVNKYNSDTGYLEILKYDLNGKAITLSVPAGEATLIEKD